MPIVLHFKHMRPGGNREGAARPYDLLVAHWQFSHTTNLMADPVRGSLARRVPTAHTRHPTAQYRLRRDNCRLALRPIRAGSFPDWRVDERRQSGCRRIRFRGPR